MLRQLIQQRNNNNPDNIQKYFNASKIQFHHGLGAFCELEIKFKDKVQLMTIDTLYVTHYISIRVKYKD